MKLVLPIKDNFAKLKTKFFYHIEKLGTVIFPILFVNLFRFSRKTDIIYLFSVIYTMYKNLVSGRFIFMLFHKKY